MFQNPNSIVIQRSGKITSSIFKYSMFKRKIDQKTVHLPIFHCLFCGSCSSQLPPPGGKFPDKFRWSSTHRFCDINVPKTTFSHGKTKIKKNGPWPPVGNFWRMTKRWENPWRSRMKSNKITLITFVSKCVGYSIENTSFNTQTLCRKSSFVAIFRWCVWGAGGCWNQNQQNWLCWSNCECRPAG